MSVVLACDLGGTSFRAALVDREGATRAESVISGPVHLDRLGWSEIDATAWWSTFLSACRELSQSAPDLFDRTQAIAICGITRTQVFLGHDGQQLRPAMTWKDVRSQQAAERLAESATGHPELSNVNAFHVAARLAWLREEEEATFRALATVLEPKDYLNYLLTGHRAGDRVSTARLLASAQPDAHGHDLLGALGASAAILPAVLEPLDRVGDVRPDLPAPLSRIAGVPVFCCSHDTWACVAGIGALRAGYAYNISGTTEVLGVMSEAPANAEGLLTVDWRGVHQLGGPSQNGADTAGWLLDVLGRLNDDHDSVSESIAALLAGVRNSQPLLFLPYLQGERVPYWDASLRGAFVGLNRQHGATDLAYAVLEGIACLNRVVLERAEAALGTKVTEIRFGGGAARNPIWAQIKADICDRPIVVGVSQQPGVLGAAIVAWTGLKQFASLSAAQDALVKIARRHAPDPTRRVACDTLFRLYRRCEDALAPISRDLAALV